MRNALLTFIVPKGFPNITTEDGHGHVTCSHRASGAWRGLVPIVFLCNSQKVISFPAPAPLQPLSLRRWQRIVAQAW